MATKKNESGAPAPKKSATGTRTTARTAGAKPAAKATAKKATGKATAAAAAAKAAAASKPAARVKPERPAPARVPGRKERRGVVVSDAMDKTIVVRVDVMQKHDRYGKVIRRSSKLHVHDEHNAARVGDLVRVVETRPLSATKRWRLLEILEKAK